MKIEYLKWDSDFFNLKIGKLEVINESDFNKKEFLIQARDENYDLIYIFKYNSCFVDQSIFESNVYLIDIMIKMSMKLPCENINIDNVEFRTSLDKNELEECYDISEQISSVSRFYIEPLIGKDLTRNLYRKWIDNALNKTYSDGIFIEKINDKIVGLHIIKSDYEHNIGYFTLTGIDSNYKRMGIGKKLWYQSFNFWNTNSNIKKIVSPFSFNNIESFNFHLKMGFNKVENIKYIYHYKKNNFYDTI